MSVTINPDSGRRPQSPWTGSQHQTQHRWQLDVATSLADATQSLEGLAAELTRLGIPGEDARKRIVP